MGMGNTIISVKPKLEKNTSGGAYLFHPTKTNPLEKMVASAAFFRASTEVKKYGKICL